ncbi:TPA: helix-turn-helix transcriptional regulator [Staphylococcus aureus]|jgi:putative transcriptional regulator|uniref:helix-turn-helix transcriptional regulator n=1 Tax=Staphylococcus TaxID=1279 RepID=UPI00046750C4|nr:helix-turn-helix transcriptional regulator [Staphylococcus epidermidis]HBI1188022.1 helix-turn-helix transcriptional regulator [Staphylococcus aureus]MCG1567024.1 helix-turn-helix transcriptional regulator [Staphylococcus epidermidis]HCW0036264.1 helix-turn-helix transcriptional regulator [Staphylococcus aureus]HCW0039045.1 helix-turn-helix transcriptional regulator [Staphylococcus aureus]HDA5091060.1 helix-turn-helix transcriptional regulator [Staphylococcus aureus]
MKNIIKERRKERNLSQKDLSMKVNVSRQTINAIENNKYDPSLSLAFDLAKALETTIEQLFENEE